MDRRIIFEELLKQTESEQVVYKKIGESNLRLLVVKSDDWKESDERTAIVWIHGGGWKNGNPEVFLPYSHYFASRGAVSICVEYRLIGKNADNLIDCILDVRAAIVYIRSNSRKFGIASDKIVVIGESAGGHLASSLANIDWLDDYLDYKLCSVSPNLIVNCNGAVDLTVENFIDAVPEKIFQSKLGEGDLLTRAKLLSPAYNVKSGQPPILHLQGELDTIVSPETTIKFHNSNLRVGNQSELVLWSDATHAFIIPNYTALNQQLVRAVVAIDSYLISKGFLEGSPNLKI